MRTFLRAAGLGLVLAVPAFAAGPAPPALSKSAGESAVALEVQVKAAYLYKFATYAEWPSAQIGGADAPLVIGVLGSDAVAAQLETQTREQRAHGRHFAVRRLAKGDSLAGVHILFIGTSNAATLDALFAAARGQPILTVTDNRAGQSRGSMITFVAKGGRLRFEVALAPANASQIRLSALLLTAATRVVREEP
jgi:hypothetical protein